MFSTFELDALKEIGNIGAGNAATALSVMLSQKVQMKIPEVKVLPFDEVSKSVGGPENPVTGIFLRVEGDLGFNILFIIQAGDTLNLLKIILRESKEVLELTAMEESALKELGNIIASAFIAALSDFTKLALRISVPSLAIDMAGAILSFPLSLYGCMGDTAFLMETEFEEGLDGVKVHFYLIPDDDKSFSTLLKTIGVRSFDGDNSRGDGGI
ncbi:chemotaxis protein CheC [Thermosediminibacter litoriperuensis]|uniref:Chemotaxis protein CheC n=1 Tax=Thermosediminibacter litoriperuensis TaxID=291989 RepID=A0A5S5AYW7_9FIRM|nr:chemotaxis protein CheC [Thermosediminibacter litoriperuensis]TYP59905.1 chemotaxis protein CheC [Thermosediminibacter litoriperuensis]